MSHTIEIQNLKKKYRVYFEKPALIKNIMPFLVSQGKAQEFWALDGVSFSMQRGECVGIIGPNGSGKSTILSILAGVSAPTEGEVTVRGKVSSLLSLGAGFNFELTGQENVYLNGALLGLSKAEIDAIYHDIVAFADLGKFMNAKLSTYSSGMNMRLGFAIAVMVPFDVLLMDEILAVGDLSFQTKCFRTMKRFYEDQGKTIIFVSHDLAKVEEICSSALWFEHGRVEASGPPSEVIGAYKERYREKFQLGPVLKTRSRGAVRALVTVDAERELRRLPEPLFGSNIDMVGDGPFLCDKAAGGTNAPVISALAPLRFGVLRYPGSQHADYFHWREAVGEARLPQISGAEPSRPKRHPSFGPAEFLEVCAATGAAPMLTLNAGTGTPEEGAGWVSWARERYRGPLYVEIGHELYYDSFHPLGADIPWDAERYARACGEFSRAVRAADPTAKIGVQCCLENGVFTRYRDPRWNEAVFALPPRTADFVSLHNASLPILNITADYRTPAEADTYAALLAAPAFVEEGLAALAAQAEARRGPGGVPVALSEYGCYFTHVPDLIHGRHRIHDRCADSVEWERNHTLAAALYEAGVLHACMRRPEVFCTARISLFSHLLTAVMAQGEGWEMVRLPQFHVHALLDRFAGKALVHSRIEVAGTSVPAVGFVPAREGVPSCDVVAVRDPGRARLALSAINRTLDSPIDMRLDLKGFPGRFCTVRSLFAEDPTCSGTQPGPRQVALWQQTLRTEELRMEDGTLRYSLPKHSLNVISFTDEDWI